MMTVPTCASAARPFSFARSDGPSVAAETWATAKAASRTRTENAAGIFLSIAFKFLLGVRSRSLGFVSADSTVCPGPAEAPFRRQRVEDSQDRLSET